MKNFKALFVFVMAIVMVLTTTINICAAQDDPTYDLSGESQWDGWESESTLVQQANGEWHYYVDGIKKNDTTLVKYNNKWFYVVDGVWNKKITSLVKYSGTWFWIQNGKWDSSFTNKIVDYNGKKFYIKNGKWDNTINVRKKIGST